MASELEELRAQNATLQNRVMALELEPYITRSGAKPEAIGYILHRLREHYTVDERGVTAQIPGTVPVSWHRWLQALRSAEPFLFAQSRTTNQEGKSGDNPWTKSSWNLTRQALVVRRDPALARTMAAEAGITLG
jgi:hypothetical protein